jgi:hypothetical protein
MQRDLVEARGWISRRDFLDGVALGQTMPGPLAAQVAMWAGYLKRGAAGVAATALAFIAPSFLTVTAVAAVYAYYSGLAIVPLLRDGVVAQHRYRPGRPGPAVAVQEVPRTLRRGRRRDTRHPAPLAGSRTAARTARRREQP